MATWFTRFNDSPQPADRFGPLEWKVLETLWQTTSEASVRDLQPQFPDIAYTTLMTTLDRLYRKGVLTRTKQGRAFFYSPRLSKPEFESARVALKGDEAALGPLMSYFVEAVSDRDHDLLDELEALVRARRAEIELKRS
jgi:predicted transcriptional regulator